MRTSLRFLGIAILFAAPLAYAPATHAVGTDNALVVAQSMPQPRGTAGGVGDEDAGMDRAQSYDNPGASTSSSSGASSKGQHHHRKSSDSHTGSSSGSDSSGSAEGAMGGGANAGGSGIGNAGATGSSH